MNLDLARHYIKFIFNSNLIQVVAYGTSFKNFSDGSNDCLPKSILKLSRSHIINEYK